MDVRPPPAAAPARSSAVRPLGILSIVFGAVVALSEVVDLVQVVLSRDRATTDLLGGVGVEIQAVAPFLAVRALTMLAMSLALVAVGIGLTVARGERLRLAAIVWCEAAFAVIVGRAVLWEAVLWPHLDRARRITTGGFAGAGFPVLGDLVGSLLELAHASEYVSLAVLVVYPVVLVAILTRRGVREGMRA